MTLKVVWNVLRHQLSKARSPCWRKEWTASSCAVANWASQLRQVKAEDDVGGAVSLLSSSMP